VQIACETQSQGGESRRIRPYIKIKPNSGYNLFILGLVLKKHIILASLIWDWFKGYCSFLNNFPVIEIH